jgi:phospholipase C
MYRCFAAAVCAAMISISLPCLASANPTKFTHIVIIVQENRTPDNLFHGLNKLLPTADIADSGVDGNGTTVPLTPLPLRTRFDIGHRHADFVAMYDGGRMDGAGFIQCVHPQSPYCPTNPSFHYVQPADVAPYTTLAVSYGFANRMFQTNQGPSFPAHQFLFSGTSQPSKTSQMFVAENPTPGPTGCAAPTSALVALVGPNGGESTSMFPCFEHATMSDLLDRPPNDPTHPVSWRYYTSSPRGIWTAPNAIRHTCQPAGSPLKCTAPQWTGGDVAIPSSQILTDIQNNALPSVSWVIPTGQDSDHPVLNEGTGPSWVASIVNAIGNSAYWSNTVIFITWDDWGGWYDHVAPPIDSTFGYYELGFRVPLLVVSPYTHAGYVSQKQHDFGSILRFIENVYNLGRIPPGNFADARSDDLMDFFDFSKPARRFSAVPTKVPASYFTNPKRRMEDPDDD